MQPIEEFGSEEYFDRTYGGNEDLGNTQPGDGAKFHGRGFVLLTGRRNYSKMTPIVRSFYPEAPDLTEEPNAAKDDKYAAVIIVYAMLTGALTGFALKNYIGDANKGGIIDFFHARKCSGGLDRADDIENDAKKFLIALTSAG